MGLSAHSRILVNKGPVFKLPKNGAFPQSLLAELYIPTRTLYLSAEALRSANKARKAKKVKERDFMRFRSQMTHETANVKQVIAFNYKDEDGEYVDWAFLKIKWGLCTGYTTTLRKFQYLAFWDPDGEVPHSYEKEPKKWRKFYEKLIDKIMDNIPVVIPGFSGLRELSESNMAYYLQRHLADQWAVQNVGPGGVNAWLNPWNEQRWEKRREEIIKELRWYLDRNFEPNVYWGAVMFESSHVVRVIDLIHDEEKNDYTMKYLDTDGIIKYDPAVYNIIPMAHEKASYVDMAFALRKFCKDNKEICKQQIENKAD